MLLWERNEIMNIINLKIIQKYWKTIQRYLIALLLVALASQVNLELFESDFVVSAGVILFVIFLYNYDDINPIVFGILSGAIIIVLRLVVYQIIGNVNTEVVTSYMPEMVFYVIYSIFYMLFLENDRKNNLGFVYIVFIICDFASNLIEVFVRYTVLEEFTFLKFIPTLLIVSFIRSSIVWIVLTAFNYYNMMLTNKEHEERYKRLLLLTSQLKTEMYFIEKNMDNIEKVIVQSNELFEKINNNKDNDKWADISLIISKEVNEIKKDNELVVRGIKDITEKELKDEGMEYKYISNILLEAIKKEMKICNKNIEFEFNIGENFYTIKHYYLISILRNLIMNSMDAIRRSQENAKISVIHENNEQLHIFTITDNGAGIDDEYLKQIFTPGFSTKVCNETGQVNRGLGLCIVKNIVEEHLKGSLEVNSKPGIGTSIVISIPRIYLEEKAHKDYKG